jgi:hypothetical protein
MFTYIPESLLKINDAYLKIMNQIFCQVNYFSIIAGTQGY